MESMESWNKSSPLNPHRRTQHTLRNLPRTSKQPYDLLNLLNERASMTRTVWQFMALEGSFCKSRLMGRILVVVLWTP